MSLRTISTQGELVDIIEQARHWAAIVARAHDEYEREYALKKLTRLLTALHKTAYAGSVQKGVWFI